MTEAFDTFLANTLEHEGYYSNHNWDRGGITLYGISRKFHPHWEGWPVWDKISAEGVPERSQAWWCMKSLVTQFYKKEFWSKVKADKLPPKVALFVADTAVNMGVGRASLFLQEAAGVHIDGIIGPNTLWHANNKDAKELLGELFDLRIEYYGVKSPEDTRKKAMKGWSKRARKLYVQCLNM